MYILLALFFVSLIAIMVMLGRQVSLLRAGMITIRPIPYHPLEPDILKAKYRVKRGLKKLGYLLLVAIFRVYFRIEHAVKEEYQDLKNRLTHFIASKTTHVNITGIKKPEPSGFLLTVSEYKNKLRTLRHKIKEEEEKK